MSQRGEIPTSDNGKIKDNHALINCYHEPNEVAKKHTRKILGQIWENLRGFAERYKRESGE